MALLPTFGDSGFQSPGWFWEERAVREDSEDRHPSHSCAHRVRTDLVVRDSPGAPTQEGPSMTFDTVPCELGKSIN